MKADLGCYRRIANKENSYDIFGELTVSLELRNTERDSLIRTRELLRDVFDEMDQKLSAWVIGQEAPYGGP